MGTHNKAEVVFLPSSAWYETFDSPPSSTHTSGEAWQGRGSTCTTNNSADGITLSLVLIHVPLYVVQQGTQRHYRAEHPNSISTDYFSASSPRDYYFFSNNNINCKYRGDLALLPCSCS